MLKWQPTANCRYETLGADTANSRGLQITTGAANTKGSWSNIGSTTSFDYHLVCLTMSPGSNTSDYVVDVGISDGTNRWIVAADIRIAGLRQNRSGGCCVMLPLHIPQAVQLSVRAAASSATVDANICLIGGSVWFGGMPGYSRMVALYTPTTSRGVDVDPTVANTKTSWVEVNSGISLPTAALLVHVGHGAEILRQQKGYLFDVSRGGAGSEEVLLANLQLAVDTACDTPFPQYFGPYPMDIPSGTRLAVRAQTDDVTVAERKIDIALWGFVR